MGKAEKMLLEHIRPATEEDLEKLPMFSYSRLEQYKNCPMAYKLKYVDEKVTDDDTSLALELGSICHYVLEMKGRMLREEGAVDYEHLNNILTNGVKGATKNENEDTKEVQDMLGINALKFKYMQEWSTKDQKSGLNYDEKMEIFDRVVHSEMEDDDWTPEYFEHYFEFVWDNKFVLHGYIDRIDMMNGFYRVVDYKTSKKSYDQSKLSTSLQFGIYALAVLLEFGQLPIEYQYRFVLIDERQQALTVGWTKRLIKHLTDLFNCVEHDHKEDGFIPSPTPLCHWCNYCKHNPQASKYKNECPYYSLWTPEKKVYQVNREWKPNDPLMKRKLIF